MSSLGVGRFVFMADGERFSIHAARKFADKYASITSEKQYAQTFWRDAFSMLFGVEDLIASGVEFEYPVRSHETGTIKFIDVLWAGVVLIEHKSAGEDLNKAEKQARDYLISLDASKRPPVIVLSDFARMRIIEVLAGTTIEFPLSELPDHMERFAAIIGDRGQGATRVEAAADIHAANLMASLFIAFEKAGYAGHATSVFLVRVLFLLFAEDTRMMRKAIFTDYVKSSPEDGTGLGAMLQELFQVLNTKPEARPGTLSDHLAGFPYVNGNVFGETLQSFSFNQGMREALLDACAYDWSKISPAIFGSLFEAARDDETRRERGEHFTSEQNILRVITDLFLNDFNDRMLAAWDSPTQLKRFHNSLAEYNWVDFAAGSGNFLVVSYKRMRAIELRVIARLQELEGKQGQFQLDGTWGLKIHLGQFHGVEIDEWSSSIALVAMFLADHQANLDLEEITGAAPDRFPLTESAHIVCDNALRLDWAKVCPMGDKTFIMGNPPFYGARFQTPEQKDDTKFVYANAKGVGEVDFVSNWHVLAARYISRHGGHAALVSTNSIVQGEQPGIIWQQLLPLGINIDFAHQTFSWSNDAPGNAAVHVVIIGFSTDQTKHKRNLWTYPDIKGQPVLKKVDHINPYLLDAPDVLITARSTPFAGDTPRMDFGSMPNDGGFLSDIDEETAERIRKEDPIAAKYIRKLVGAKELIQNIPRYCLWLQDADPADIRKSPELSKRVEEVKNLRAASKREATKRLASRPAEFGEIRQPKGEYLAVPATSSENREYVPLAVMPESVITNNAVLVVGGMKSIETFGMLASKVFSVWNRAVSGRLESRLRISATITYNNFPFPELTEELREEIERGAQSVLVARSSFAFNSLADLYAPNAMPDALRRAHNNLDKAVLKAFGLPATATDEQILTKLFARYAELTEGLLAVPAKKARR